MFRWVVFFSLFAGGCLHAQKVYSPVKIQHEVTIDGQLNDTEWSAAEYVENFTQITPDAGAASTRKTKVKLMYDDDALYIAAVCYENPGDISKVLCQRDSYNANTDYFSIMLDTYKDRQNGFVFSASSMNVQYDAKIYNSSYNSKLDIIWFSEIQHTDSAWIAEIKIPYAAIRFAKEDVQNWGINFTRYISVNREEASWSPISPELDNVVAQGGTLEGLKKISPPLRLFLLPYVSGYAEHFPKNIPEERDWGYSFNGGMDIKYGINEAFTLDMTLIPDFGQVVSDNVVLNLTPFEVQFPENRQFFNEGTELFEKAGLFYSRRVGGVPLNRNKVGQKKNDNEVVVSNPIVSQLFNATKFSGRTKGGLGIGVFNAISATTEATLEDTLTLDKRTVQTAPLTNYNILVLDQNLKNNSFVGLTNTNVWRSGTDYEANVTSVNSRINNKENKYFAAGNVAVSQKYFSDSVGLGHNWSVSAGKQKGNLIYSASYLEQSNTYDPNDLGFLLNNNKRNINGSASYNIYKPFWKLNSLRSNVNVSYQRLYSPDVFTGLFANGTLGITNKKFHSASLQFNSLLTPNYDYFEPRKWGAYFKRPRSIRAGGWISSNYQKRLAIDANLFTQQFQEDEWWALTWSFSPRIRVSDQLFFIYNYNHSINFKERGFAIPFQSGAPQTEDIIFGQRDVNTRTHTIDLLYTMTNRMGITFRLRHYRSSVTYFEFFHLQEDGTLLAIDYDGLNNDGSSIYNTNYNAFTIDLVYRWVFAPASEINVVWKNNIFTNNDGVTQKYLQNIQQTLWSDQLNSFSLRIVYYLDYQFIKNINKSKT